MFYFLFSKIDGMGHCVVHKGKRIDELVSIRKAHEINHDSRIPNVF